MDSSDSDDDVIVSSLMLVASTIYRRRQLRVRICNRTIWARQWISQREEYGAYNGLVREIRVNDTASYRNFLRMDDTSFDTLLHKEAVENMFIIVIYLVKQPIISVFQHLFE